MLNIQTQSASQPPLTVRLSATSRERAVNFLLARGTNLQRERYLYHFEGGPQSNVLAALRHYQNVDGGFGHGLEADLRTRHSSVVATTVALQVLGSVDALESDLAKQAISYLVGEYDGRNWHCITPECNDAPHAPWWRLASNESGEPFNANPNAEVLAYLLRHGAMASETPDLVWRAMEDVTREDLDIHEFLCYLRLHDARVLCEADQEHLLVHLLAHAYRLVKVKPWNWEEYGLTPLSVTAARDSAFVRFFGDSLEANLDFLVDHQLEDGSWTPTWSWAGEFPATWKNVELEVRAELTLQNLLHLARFDRLPA